MESSETGESPQHVAGEGQLWLLRFSISLACVLLAYHSFAEVDFSLPRRLGESIPRVFGLLPGHVGSTAKHRRAMEMLQEARLSHAEETFGACSWIIAIVLTMRVISACATNVSELDAPQLLYICLTYAICLTFKYKRQKSTFDLTLCMSTVQLLLLIRILTFQSNQVWVANTQVRAISRLFFGILDLDCCRSAIWSVVFTAANIYKTYQLGGSTDRMGQAAVSEMTTSLFIWALCRFAELYVTGHMDALIDITLSQGEKTQVRHLLSVFCDIQIQLDSHWNITEEDGRLSQMLGMPHLEGFSFADCLVDADKSRFAHFMNALALRDARGSVARQDDSPSRFPGSLHMHMQTAGGAFIAVQIFHTVYPSLEGARHLLGIRVEKESDGTESGLSHDLSVDEVSEHIHERSGSVVRPEDSVSAHGVSTVSTTEDVPMEELQDVDITVDVFSEDFAVQSCLLRFQPLEDASDAGKIPKLADWFIDRAGFEQLKNQTLSQVNEASHHGAVLQPELGPQKLRMPGEATAVSLIASSAKVLVNMVGQDSGTEDENDDDDEDEDESVGVEVMLRFSGFSAQRKGPRMRSRTARGERMRGAGQD
eukprot:TRINITY_DN40318_c0_g1_i1.p1 TRINITY_DN40318_c0_g1~~TRINITY_DN40318_c0_g1_i1.p1  ORF type:complete len:596 (+),score=91.48 TRINITY_DN40318_c0_g1_i1:57-1844(+)